MVCKGSNAAYEYLHLYNTDELRLDILTTIVISKDIESPPRLVLNQGLKDLEEVKKFILVL